MRIGETGFDRYLTAAVLVFALLVGSHARAAKECSEDGEPTGDVVALHVAWPTGAVSKGDVDDFQTELGDTLDGTKPAMSLCVLSPQVIPAMQAKNVYANEDVRAVLSDETNLKKLRARKVKYLVLARVSQLGESLLLKFKAVDIRESSPKFQPGREVQKQSEPFFDFVTRSAKAVTASIEYLRDKASPKPIPVLLACFVDGTNKKALFSNSKVTIADVTASFPDGLSNGIAEQEGFDKRRFRLLPMQFDKCASTELIQSVKNIYPSERWILWYGRIDAPEANYIRVSISFLHFRGRVEAIKPYSSGNLPLKQADELMELPKKVAPWVAKQWLSYLTEIALGESQEQ